MTVIDMRFEIDGVDDRNWREIETTIREKFKDKEIFEISLLNID